MGNNPRARANLRPAEMEHVLIAKQASSASADHSKRNARVHRHALDNDPVPVLIGIVIAFVIVTTWCGVVLLHDLFQ